MAVDLHSSDSLLLSSQSQFLTDDMKSRSNCHNQPIKPTSFSSSSSSSSSGFGFSDFGSSMSSPVESEMGSNESASDQDDEYIVELTRQMAHQMLEDDENKVKNEEETCFGSSLLPISVPSSTTMKEPKSSNLDFQSKQALIDYQIRAIQFYKLKQEQITKHKEESLNWGKKANGHNNTEANKQFHQSKGRRSFNLQKTSWPNLPQKGTVNSQMTAYFLGDKSGSRTASCGTGVFLPRAIINTCDSRKKSGCSTVLIPARVVQALKFHFDKMGVEPRFLHGASFPIQDDGLLMDEVSYGQQQVRKKSQARPEPAKNHHHHQEIGLPQEWTY